MIEMIDRETIKNIKGLIFDCDGVMIDSEEGNRYMYNKVLASFGRAPMTREEEEYAFMATASDAFRNMLPESLYDKIEDRVKREIDYRRDVLTRTKLMPGYREFIDQAYARGLKLAIDTNRTDAGIQRVLDFFQLPAYFDPIMSSSNAAPKPSPEAAREICAAWGVAPASALFVGDSENDREAALGAGTLFAAFGGKGLPGDIEVASYAELAKILWN